ncbi:hypothetical protein AcV5_008622 [Taiwanofungus camphoratus]|nr:hypothetical protein AcV5_008622 [Antrodia cinnamomea]
MHVGLRHPKNLKRQANDPTPIPTGPGFSGVEQETAVAPSASNLILASATGLDPDSFSAPALATVTPASSPSPTSSSSADPSASADTSSASSHNSAIPIGTVVGACVGAFAGLAVVLYLLFWYIKRTPNPKSRGRPLSYSRNAQGEVDRGRTRSQQWRKLDGDRREGVPGSAGTREMEESNFAMFKKSPSIRTTRTKTSDDEHGFGLPPFEFSKYHPNLAAELALEQPSRPFAKREDSGISWDGSTVADESFLSMRSVESGTMSPTMVMAKVTPPATTAIHKWESAEVLTMEEENVSGPKEVQNPFADVTEERRGASNPFFNAQEMNRRSTISHSRSRSRSRSDSHTSRVSRARSMALSARESQRISNPFADVHDVPVYRVSPPAAAHVQKDSVASGSSANLFNEHAMKSLLAALDLTQDQVEERLRVVSMQDSTASRYSSLTGIDDESVIATVREFPMPPADAHVLL